MKFVLASYGTRGDIEPSLVVARELARRGHDVCLAVAPDSVGFVEAAGLPAVAFGLDTRTWLDVYRNFWTTLFRSFWRIRELRQLWREMWTLSDQCWAHINATLRSAAEDADVLIAGQAYQEPAANVAEYYGIPLITLHHVPVRPNGRLVTILPPALGRAAMTLFDWFTWLLNKKVDDTQRRELGLPKATSPAAQRIARRGSLEVQAYDDVCFPGLAAEWAKWDGQRPFVGTLTMELPTNVDDEVASWIAAGTPPICFGFGSMPVESPADTIRMIAAASAALGERALVCAGYSDFSDVPRFDHVKVVGAVNYAAIFPACRAVVHHGGSGTTAASMRAGVPTLILSMDANQTLWGAQLKRLKIGTTRRFSATTQDSLVADLRQILAPDYVARARSLATKMTRPAESNHRAADVVEDFARLRSMA
ncbi:glycosyl transferase family protein [Mycolicibacterium mageritense DSM 44476 = CIP 104973]|uniref:Glycosyl transferase family 1 n=1 Tax=Mycolicibacterium mageritense TaxID=53462 RepID=A0AAI8XKA0_MYCME|nr:glycosyltransferase [Mycolicibacterium mageritense]MCC9185013.1 glycosyltransferase [Mycolicibacterium mageritense]CDO21499.1 glycosyl transferase family protein [Mycolicibacterium mageritense DSM 44476 = CIP 104973]BBX33063.1 glycosyl transferase family 1 [Mycolicibacterium mageritense]BDY28314.1 putative glycosyltransferase [Mycolicibacterium mageritense]GJJ22843.1 glycosyl transferase family 1 [Mycolicibacterium mageritense]